MHHFPLPKNQAKIESRLDEWRTTRGVMRAPSHKRALTISHLLNPSVVEREVLYAGIIVAIANVETMDESRRKGDLQENEECDLPHAINLIFKQKSY